MQQLSTGFDPVPPACVKVVYRLPKDKHISHRFLDILTLPQIVFQISDLGKKSLILRNLH